MSDVRKVMSMSKATICILIATLIAAPCILDTSSTEPSPLGVLLTAVLNP